MFKPRLTSKEKRLLSTARAGDVNNVKGLIEQGVDVNCAGAWADHFNVTPLMYAAGAGHRRVLQLLLKAGADVHARDGSAAMQGGGATPLHYALLRYEGGTPDSDVISDLLKAGADPNSRLANGSTALELACEVGHLDAVRLLLKYKGEPNRLVGPGDQGPALCEAALGGHLSIVKLLLKAGARVNGTDYDGLTPLMAAALCSGDGDDHDNIVHLLLRHGAEVNAVDGKGQSAVIHAVDQAACSLTKSWFRHCFKVVRTLVEIGRADVNIKDTEERAALDYSSVSDFSELPAYLRKMGAKSGLARDSFR